MAAPAIDTNEVQRRQRELAEEARHLLKPVSSFIVTIAIINMMINSDYMSLPLVHKQRNPDLVGRSGNDWGRKLVGVSCMV